MLHTASVSVVPNKCGIDGKANFFHLAFFYLYIKLLSCQSCFNLQLCIFFYLKNSFCTKSVNFFKEKKKIMTITKHHNFFFILSKKAFTHSFDKNYLTRILHNIHNKYFLSHRLVIKVYILRPEFMHNYNFIAFFLYMYYIMK